MRSVVSMGGSNNGAPWPLLSDRTWVVQGWHGTPLKAIARGWSGHPDLRSVEVVERADFFVSPGAEYTRRMMRCYHISPNQFWELGNPRNDVLVRATAADTKDRQATLRAALGGLQFDRVVMYAPTWREYLEKPTFVPVPDRD